jgi:hypothetical protein
MENTAERGAVVDLFDVIDETKTTESSGCHTTAIETAAAAAVLATVLAPNTEANCKTAQRYCFDEIQIAEIDSFGADQWIDDEGDDSDYDFDM